MCQRSTKPPLLNVIPTTTNTTFYAIYVNDKEKKPQGNLSVFLNKFSKTLDTNLIK